MVRRLYTTAKWASALQQTEWKEKGKKLKVLKQFNSMSTGQTIVDTMAFGRRLSGSSIQSGSSDESALKKLKTTGTYPLNAKSGIIKSDAKEIETRNKFRCRSMKSL